MTIKALHVGRIFLSVSLFVLRVILQWLDMPWRRWAILRITPLLFETVLLGSALWLVFATRQYPFVDGWLTAKVLALFAYIGFGMQALAPGAPPNRRAFAFAATFVSVGQIVGVAMTRSPSLGIG